MISLQARTAVIAAVTKMSTAQDHLIILYKLVFKLQII